jgi:amino acid adenylation domain-containing protein
VSTSAGQKQLWHLARIENGGSLAYHLRTVLEVRGRLDEAALRGALEELAQRHEALRARFSEDGDTMEIAGHVSMAWERYDLSGAAPEERARRLAAWLDEEADRPFDLLRAPLWRAHVLCLESDLHWLVFSIHHLVCDGASQARLLEEWGALFSSRCTGFPTRLRPPLSFADHLERETEQERSGGLAEHETFWSKQLEGVPEALHLPSDRPAPRLRSYRGGTVRQRLGAEELSRVRSCAAQQGCTPSMVLLAAYAILLHRLSCEDDLLVGVPAAGPGASSSASLVGFCSNLLALRSRIDDVQTVAAHLLALRSTLLDALEHERYPFARLLDRLAPRRDGSRPPLISAVFNWDRVAVPVLAGTAVVPVYRPLRYARFDLGFDVFAEGEALVLDWDYNVDRFDPETVERIADSFRALLCATLANPLLRVREAPLLSAADRQRLLVEWNATDAVLETGCLHHRFERQAERTPEAIAVCCGEQRLTYAELDRRADRLARRLHDLQVGAESRVGLLAGRSIEAIVGLLAILKAGGAYVPLDPRSPAGHLGEVIRQTAMQVLLVESRWQEQAPSGITGVVLLDGEPSEPEGRALPPGGAPVVPSNLCYVLFTSGSTGRPKGVEVEHRQLSNYTSAILRRLGLPEGSSYLTLAPLTVDLGHTALYPALVSGGCLHLVPEDAAIDPAALARYCASQRLDCLKITPSHLEALMAGSSPQLLLPERCLVVGGEPLRWDLTDRLRALAPELVIFNHYGPTEATVGALAYRVPPDTPPARGATVPLGCPLDNVCAYILDAHAQPVPAGLPGELWLGGAGVSRGYLQQPGATSERFLPNPWNPGSLYRTGDRCRHRADGTIEFLGRMDRQVKILGFRVEPEELEHRLMEHPAVRECAVVNAGDGRGGGRLEAYVVPADPARPPSGEELRQFLRGGLPDFLVPVRISALAELPHTASGKVDRTRLPLGTAAMDPEQVEAPATEMEREVAEAWRDVLALPVVGRRQSFFDLGANSLHVLQVTTRICRRLAVDLSPRSLFETPTVAGLAERLETVLWARKGAESPAGAAAGEICVVL